jgi:hypothetical protein
MSVSVLCFPLFALGGLPMKGRHFCLILVVATFGANAESLNEPTAATAAVPVPLSAGVALNGSPPLALLTPNAPYGPGMTPALVAGFRQDMINNMKATRAFLHKGAVKASKYDAWLLLLAGIGLVVLQLRRTQKALPQRSIIGY